MYVEKYILSIPKYSIVVHIVTQSSEFKNILQDLRKTQETILVKHGINH